MCHAHALGGNRIQAPPLQMHQLSLSSSHRDLLRAVRSYVSSQEQVKGNHGISSGYIVVTRANIWISTSKVCGYTLRRFCLKSLSPHYNIFCSRPLQIPSWFAKWPGIAKVPWSRHLQDMVFANKNLMVSSRRFPCCMKKLSDERL